MLTAVLVTASACSSGSNSPTPGGTSSGDTSGTTGGTPTTTKLHKETAKGAVKNVFAKTPGGTKLTLYAASPGHEIMEQIYNADAKAWSQPTSVFKDTTRFCHSIKLKSKGPVMAATVMCAISAQDVNGTESSYVLASTDGKTWKRADLSGATGKPSISPNGKFVSWSSPTAFLLWDTTGQNFVTAKYTQSSSAPTVGVRQDDGSLLLIEALPTQNKTCTISFQSVTAKAPTPKAINSTLPQPDHPHCVITSAKMQGSDLIANFVMTTTTKDSNGKKVTKSTTFAYAFQKITGGKWVIKSS